MSRHASIPEPSGSRTSITTRSGWKRRAAASDSATVPASATTWNSGRRSSSETSPWRTTSWSSTTSSVSGRVAPSVMPLHSPDSKPGLRPADGRGPSSPVASLVTSTVAPMAAMRERMLRRPWCPRTPIVDGSNPWPLSSTTRSSPPGSALFTKTVARLAPECRAMLLRASLTTPRRCPVASGSGSSSTSPTCSSTSIIELWRNSSTTATRPLMRVVPLSSSGRRPKMKLRMSRIVRCRLSMARSTRRSTSVGVVPDQLRARPPATGPTA